MDRTATQNSPGREHRYPSHRRRQDPVTRGSAGPSGRSLACLRRAAGRLARVSTTLGLLQEQLRDPDPDQRLFGIVLVGFVPDARIKDQLWRPVNFRDDHFYPSDALVRHAAMSSLLWIAIEELAVAHSPGGTTHPTLTSAPARSPREWLLLRLAPHRRPARIERLSAHDLRGEVLR